MGKHVDELHKVRRSQLLQQLDLSQSCDVHTLPPEQQPIRQPPFRRFLTLTCCRLRSGMLTTRGRQIADERVRHANIGTHNTQSEECTSLTSPSRIFLMATT